jgi:hypothetical protein
VYLKTPKRTSANQYALIFDKLNTNLTTVEKIPILIVNRPIPLPGEEHHQTMIKR